MKNSDVEKLADAILVLRQKCLAKDRILIHQFEIGVAEYNCLSQYFQDNNLSVKELADRMDITSGGVTRIVTSLEEKGILERKIDPEDRRGIIVSLTEKGKYLVKDMKEKSVEIHKEILKNVDKQKRVQLLDGVEQLIFALDSWINQVK